VCLVKYSTTFEAHYTGQLQGRREDAVMLENEDAVMLEKQ
jgi:hypothetical protein